MLDLLLTDKEELMMVNSNLGCNICLTMDLNSERSEKEKY